jgi:hypothetical protein
MIDLTNRTLYAGPIVALLAALLAFAFAPWLVLPIVAAGFAWPPLWFAVQFAAARPAPQRQPEPVEA